MFTYILKRFRYHAQHIPLTAMVPLLLCLRVHSCDSTLFISLFSFNFMHCKMQHLEKTMQLFSCVKTYMCIFMTVFFKISTNTHNLFFSLLLYLHYIQFYFLHLKF
jgi:hypothetical protein